MKQLVRASGLAALLLGSGLGTGMLNPAVGQSAAVGQPAPEMVTTDTVSYCHELEAKLDQLKRGTADLPQDVNELGVAGKQMCDHGAVIGGILRLRSAIVLLMHPEGDTSSVRANRAE